MEHIPATPESQLPAIRRAREEHTSNDTAILDVGGGDGRWQRLLGSPTDYMVVDLVDPSSLTLGPNATYVEAGAESLPFLDRAFGCVLLMEVLEHLPDPSLALSEAERVLVPGGLLVLSTRQMWRTHGAPSDYFRYTRYGLERLLERNGLKTLELRPLGGPASVIAATLDSNLPVLTKPIVKQVLSHSMWRFAALLDRTVFRENVQGSAPDTTGWLVIAHRPSR